jgi:hypothetical protein
MNSTQVASEHGMFYHYLWDPYAGKPCDVSFEHLDTMYVDD